MLGEVEVAPRGDALQLLLAKRKLEGDVGTGPSVMGKLFLGVNFLMKKSIDQ